MTDLRLAARILRKQPGSAALAIIALALGIGLTTIMFSIVNGAVLRGLPFERADRILHLAPFDTIEQEDEDSPAHAFAEYVRRQQSFEQLAAFYFATANVVGPDGMPERYRAAWVTANTFKLLRVSPALGRDFQEEDGRPGAAPVVMISHRLWEERFKASLDAVGQSIRVDGTAMTVAGVMPPRFAFPQSQDIWPVAIINPNTPRSDYDQTYEVIGRLKDEASVERASAEMATIWQQLALEFPDRYDKAFTIEVKGYIEEFMGTETINALYAMLAAVFGVLIIACANVANLVLARAADRGREIAVRTAIGASRFRVVRQMLVEVLVLAGLGAIAGLAIAQAGIVLFNRGIVDTNPPFWIDIKIDTVVLLFVTATTMIAAIAAGVVPAIRASRADLAAIMNDEGRTTGIRLGRFSRALVVAEMALSFGLLVVSALVIQSIVNITREDFGLPLRDVVAGRVTLPNAEYPDDDRQYRFAEELLNRLQSVHGVVTVALATDIAPGAAVSVIKFPGETYAAERDYPTARVATITPEYFKVLRVGVLQGRGFDARDRRDSEPVALVNERFARRYFPNGALGRQFALARGNYQQWRTIVGIVPDLGLGQTSQGQVPEGFYVPFAQIPPSSFAIAVHAAGAPLDLATPLRETVRSLDANIPLYNIATLQQSKEQGTWPFRVFGSLFMAFGFAGLFLATIGLYGVMSFSVRKRTQEIGVRMAMGAGGREVLMLVLRQGLWQIGLGIGLGVGLAAALASALWVLFFGVSPRDPLTFLAVGAVLGATGLLACLVPARRATHLDPMTALRYQ